ncbi:hypothetical protein WICPIJ_000308 [Wickerhamomyces pijperi]|uniref:Stationary phase protein 5 n=1 Tax=Wickerhamomyces pijperi TaxID=599730 RepID=A0A9P8QE09_WICPI|nr:hypothetical protein WICPIJ_000308 [Wickerhamomyces pijperi]
MVANRLKNLASITKEAVRDARRALEELVNALSPRPQPQLVPIPIRNQVPRSPFANGRSGIRHFSTARLLRASSTTSYSSNISSIFSKFINQQQARNAQFVRSNLNAKFWTKTAYGSRPFNSRIAQFGANRYVGLGARTFGTYGGSASHQTIFNLTTGFRCLVSNGSDETQRLYSLKMEKIRSSSGLTYHGCSSTSEAPKTIKLARLQSQHFETVGCHVEFELPRMEVKIPSMSFINDEIMESFDISMEQIKLQITKVQENIQKIFTAYGSLPIERTSTSIRIHFPNLDPEEAERLLIELGITEGYVYANDEAYSSSNVSTESFFNDSTTLSQFIEETVPGLISSDSSEDSDSGSSLSFETNEFFHPVLSSSGFSTGGQEPIVISSATNSFSEMSY